MEIIVPKSSILYKLSNGACIFQRYALKGRAQVLQSSHTPLGMHKFHYIRFKAARVRLSTYDIIQDTRPCVTLPNARSSPSKISMISFIYIFILVRSQ